MGDDRRSVYVTGIGRINYCSRCGAPEEECRCRTTAPAPPKDGFVRIARDKKGRGGKVVTTISGMPLAPGELEMLAQTLKKLCGAGGTVKDGVIEIQGDVRERVEPKLVALGYRVKRVGG